MKSYMLLRDTKDDVIIPERITAKTPRIQKRIKNINFYNSSSFFPNQTRSDRPNLIRKLYLSSEYYFDIISKVDKTPHLITTEYL